MALRRRDCRLRFDPNQALDCEGILSPVVCAANVCMVDEHEMLAI
jgi:hypothetical protein